jgi:hypothetical protein
VRNIVEEFALYSGALEYIEAIVEEKVQQNQEKL